MRAHVHTSFGAFPHIFLATLILIVEVFSKFLNYDSSNEGNGAFWEKNVFKNILMKIQCLICNLNHIVKKCCVFIKKNQHNLFPSLNGRLNKIFHVDSCQPNSDLLPPQTLNSVHLLVMSNGIHDGLPDLWPLWGL